ncbi:MAG: dTDP-4-dehydrorhamnose reductase [Candidatus Marinimicrobia bacterium]|jgi:dTDP-4-dehydrorhamnose reductase|nr:dTDP-4-dehydrorhamnose reductase [Candidatus Neomarinimicrobiota bacterium]MDP6612039.1 dTDP-4-dehydrorhamnose reductase [Candidatus Neomarinimicrobiota bacterium]|tara:strand:- start:18421 stop:19302 length:882 start_codon:yes stop_codon:yes gene_type:complete
MVEKNIIKTILITGAYGQLGEACLKYLKSNFEIKSTGRHAPDDGIHLDITDSDSVHCVIAKTNPDVILNLAAMTNVDGCETNPEMAESINVDGVKNLCHQFEGQFIQISTDYVFDGRAGPYSESDETNPISVYGKTKLAADEWLLENQEKTTIIRTNVVYGYTNRTQASFVKWVVDSLNDGKPINVVDDQWNNPTWTESLASVISRLIEGGAFGLYHYGDKDLINRCEFAHLIAKVFELDASLISPISTAELDQPAPRPLKSGLKTEKIESELGIVPNSVETCLMKIRKQLSR